MNGKRYKVSREIFLTVPVDQVWAFLMNDEKMKIWFKANAFTIDAYGGGEIEIPFSFGGETCLIEGEVGLVMPKKKFAFTWIERDQYGEAWFNNTMVTIELEEHKSGSKLTLTHDGFQYLPEEIQTAVYHKYLSFWETSGILDRLQTLILET
jgi:uncharacterized protein YndB with AHSA1/START domain